MVTESWLTFFFLDLQNISLKNYKAENEFILWSTDGDCAHLHSAERE